MKMVRWCLIAVLVAVSSQRVATADVRLPEVISNNMVLQKDIPLPIWGWADAGEEVTVTLGDESRSTTAAAGASAVAPI